MRDFAKQMEMVFYHSDEGDVSVDAYIKDESIWITQKAMAELFGVDKSGISRHLKKIFESRELDEKVVVADVFTGCVLFGACLFLCLLNQRLIDEGVI